MTGELPFPSLDAPASVDPRREALLFAAAFSLVAGAIHAVAAIGHFAHIWWYGLGFALLSAFQFGWGVLAYPNAGPRLIRVGVAVSLGVVAVWVLSRTAGIPFGPEAFDPEPVGTLDVGATVDELALVAILAALTRGRLDLFVAQRGRLAVYTLLTLTALTVFLGPGHTH